MKKTVQNSDCSRQNKKKESKSKKDSEQPDLNQRPKDISFPTTVFRYYQLSYARFVENKEKYCPHV